MAENRHLEGEERGNCSAMEQIEILSRLSVSLAIGLLVGLERGWRTREEEDHQRAAGFRTFALSGLMGGVAALLSLKAGGAILGFAFTAYTAAFAAFHWLEARAERNLSATSVIAGMLTFLLGAMAVTGELLIAAACAVAMTLLLALRESLHRWVASLTWEEIRAALTLLAMSFLLLPILPNRRIDPWGAINPHEIWLLAILIAAISFGGYIAVKAFGARLGILLTGVAGGLASSTATTLAFGRLGREHREAAGLLSAGILMSGTVMLMRVAVVAVVLNPALLTPLAPPLAAAGVALACGAAVFLWGQGGRQSPNLQIGNPLALGMALKLAALIGGVALTAELLRRAYGDIGVFLVAALSGIVDVDALTIAMARLGAEAAEQDSHHATAVRAILLAVAVNTVSKTAMAWWTGGARIGVRVAAVSLAALGAGATALIFTPFP